MGKHTAAPMKSSFSNVQFTSKSEIKSSLSESPERSTIKEGVAVEVGGGGVGGDGGYAGTPVSSLVLYQIYSISNIQPTSTFQSSLYTPSLFESLGISKSDKEDAVRAGGGGIDGGGVGGVGGYADMPMSSSVIFNQTYYISNIQPTSTFQSNLYTASLFESLRISTSDKEGAVGAGGGGIDGGGVGGVGGVGGYADMPMSSSVIFNQTYYISNIQPSSTFQSYLYTASLFESLGISTSDKEDAVRAGGGIDGGGVGGVGGVGGYADMPMSSSVIFNQTYSISNIQPTSTFQNNLYTASPFESLRISTSDKEGAVGAGGGGVDGGGVGVVGGYADTPTSSSVIFNQTNEISNIQLTSIDHGNLYTASLYKSREGRSSSDTVVVVGAGGGGVDEDGVDGGGGVGGGGAVVDGGYAGIPLSSSVTFNHTSYTSWIDMTPSTQNSLVSLFEANSFVSPSTLANMILSPTPSQVTEAKSSQALTTIISESVLSSSQDVIATETSSNQDSVWTSVIRKDTSSVVASPSSTTEILMMSQTSNGIVEVKYRTSSTVTKDSDDDDKFVRFYG